MRRIALQLAIELGRIGQRLDLKALLGEIAREQIAQARVVVHDQNFRCLRFHEGILRQRARRQRGLCFQL